MVSQELLPCSLTSPGDLSLNEQRTPGILINDAGIRLIEASVNTTVTKRVPLDPSITELAEFFPPIDDRVAEELLQVQLNRFSCGGLVTGATIHHRVDDGQPTCSFLLSSQCQEINPPRCEFDDRAVESGEITTPTKSLTSLKTSSVPFSPNFITKLKTHFISSSTDDADDIQYSTLECLLAHPWKKITDEITHVRIGRPRLKPAVPAEYFGNSMDDAYFRSFIDFGLWKADRREGVMVAELPEAGSSLSPGVEVDSWLRFQFHEIDFGAGGPCDVTPPYLPLDGLLILLRSCKVKGGIHASVSLCPEHLDHFKIQTDLPVFGLDRGSSPFMPICCSCVKMPT
ncbi:hypothetical protein ACLOJK_039404 [Asimina triloba]